ncbi:unnamed protein product [Paramecium pentaurelia]|uniref:t-SNARE coiled-coil homology domain-containing protein n=1 Tax=Paramecium pentaurelia TaxID=43138 RepID=A0A8S1WSJ8_9CILI|nr:unnamed protein product [Paramecium pentaurelia]
MSYADFGQNIIDNEMKEVQQKAQDGWDIEEEDFPSDHGNQDQQQQLNNFRDYPNQNQKNNEWEIDDDIDDLSQTPAESQLKQEQQTKFQQDEQKSPEQIDMWGKFTNTVQQTQTIEKLIKESAPQKIKQTFQNLFGSQNSGSNNIIITSEQTQNSKVFASVQQVIDMKKLFELEKSELEDQMKLRRIQEQNELNEQKEELENKIKQFQIEKEQFNQQLKEAKQLFKLTELIEPQDNHEQIICKLIKENENLNNDITKLIETQEKQINDYEDNIEQMQQEIEYYKNQFIKYQTKYQNTKEKIRIEIPKIQNQLMTIKKLELHTQVTNKLTQFQKYYNTKQQDLLQYALQTTSKQSKQISSLKEDNIKLMQQIDELDELKDEHQSSLYIIKQLRVSEDKLIEENERLQNQNQDKENQNFELQNKLDNLKREYDQEKFNLNQLITQLQSQIDQINRNQVDKSSIKKLEDSLALIQEEKKTLLSSLENKETQIIVLEQQIQELNEEFTKQQNIDSNDIWKQEDRGWELDDSFQRKYDELELQMIQYRNENHELKYQLKEMEVRMLQQQHKQEAQVEQMHQLQMCLVDTEYQKNFQNAVQQERIQELEEQISIEKRKFSDEEEKVSEQNLQGDEDSQRAINQLRQIDYEENEAQREDGAWEFEDSLNVDIQEQENINEGAGQYQNIQLSQGQNIQQDHYEKQVDENSDFQDEIQQNDFYIQDDSKQNDQSDNNIHQQNDLSQEQQEQEDNQNIDQQIQQNIENDSEELSEKEGLLQNYDEENEDNYEKIEESQDYEINQNNQQNEEFYDEYQEQQQEQSVHSSQDNQVNVQEMNLNQNNLDNENIQDDYSEIKEGSQKQEEIQNEEGDSEYQNVEYESQENNDDQIQQDHQDQISSNDQIELQQEDKEGDQREYNSNEELNQEQEDQKDDVPYEIYQKNNENADQVQQQYQEQNDKVEQEQQQDDQQDDEQDEEQEDEQDDQQEDEQDDQQEDEQDDELGNEQKQEDEQQQEINSDEFNQEDQQNIYENQEINSQEKDMISQEYDQEQNNNSNKSLQQIDVEIDNQINQYQINDKGDIQKQEQIENELSNEEIYLNQQNIQNNLQIESNNQVINKTDELIIQDSNNQENQENNQNNEEIQIQNEINKEQEQLEIQYQLVVEPINNSNFENQVIEKSLGDLDVLDIHINNDQKKVVINSSNQIEKNYNIEIHSQKNALLSQDPSPSYQEIGVQEIISKPLLFSDPRSQEKSANDQEDEIQNDQEHYEIDVGLNEQKIENLENKENLIENPDEEEGNQWNVDDDIDFENELENPQVQIIEEKQSNQQIIEPKICDQSQNQQENERRNQEPLENWKVNQQFEEETPDVQFDDDQENQEDQSNNNNNPPIKNVEKLSQGQLDLDDELEEIDPWAEQQKQGENAESGWDLDDI